MPRIPEDEPYLLPFPFRRRFLVVLALTAAAVVACVSDPGSDARTRPEDGATTVPPTTAPGLSTTTPTPAPSPTAPGEGPGVETVPGAPPTEAERALLADLGGLLAVADGGRLAVVRPDGTEVRLLNQGDEALADQPAWSADGARVAWSRNGFDAHDLVVSEPAGGEDTVSPAPGPPAFYLQWAPGGERLAYLRNDPGGQGLEVGTARPGQAARPVGIASPLFLAWSPSTPELALHVNGSQVVRIPADFIETDTDTQTDIEPDGEAEEGTEGDEAPARPDPIEPDVIVDPTGQFTAPVWIDARTVLALGQDGLAFHDVEAGTSELLLAETEIRFVLSPDRRRLAYHVESSAAGVSPVGATQTPGPPPRPRVPTAPGLAVLDLDTDETVVVADVDPLSFEWSPDGRNLAWLVDPPGAAPDLVQWWFWAVGSAAEEATATESYAVSPRVALTVLPFFEQFAQSTRRWSPDGRAFAFAGVLDGRPANEAVGIWVHLVSSGEPTIRVADGDLVTWGG